jgi:hypothetical protein
MYSNLLIFPDKSARLSRVVWDAPTPVTKAHLDLEPSAVVVADAGRCWRRAAVASNHYKMGHSSKHVGTDRDYDQY